MCLPPHSPHFGVSIHEKKKLQAAAKGFAMKREANPIRILILDFSGIVVSFMVSFV